MRKPRTPFDARAKTSSRNGVDAVSLQNQGRGDWRIEGARGKFRREIEDLTNERKSLAESLGKVRQAKDKLEERLAGSEARIEGLLQEIDAMDAASAQASMHVSNAMASASEAHRRSLQEMRGKQAEAEAYIESLDARLEALEEEKDALRRELERAYARERETRVRLQETEKRSNELTSEINALLEQDARRHTVQIETDLLAHVARTPTKAAARSPRSNAFTTTSAGNSRFAKFPTTNPTAKSSSLFVAAP